MVMTSLAKAITTPKAGSMRRAENRPYAIQVVLKTDRMFWVTKGIILKNPPITAVRPTPRQAEWRYIFATEGAPQWRGSRGVGTLKYDSVSGKHKAGDLVLAVQARAQEVLRGLSSRLTKPKKTEKPRYSVNTIESLKKLAGL